MTQRYPDPVTEWNEKLSQKVATGMNRQKAVLAVSRENPGLHEAYIRAVNEARPAAVSQRYGH